MSTGCRKVNRGKISVGENRMKSPQTQLLRVFLALVLAATPLWPTVAASQNVWRSYGPDGGTVTALAIDPQTPTTLYAAISDSRVFAALGDLPPGRLFKTTDGRSSWLASGTGLPNIRINGIYVDPHAPTTIYLSMYGGRIFKSIDGGESWHGTSVAVGGPYPAIPVAGIVFDPQIPGTAYAAGGGGIVKTIDGGSTWRTIIAGFPANAGIRSIAIDPKIPTTLYAGIVPNSASQARGVFKSTDGGATWRSTSLTDVAVVVLVIDPQTSTTLYAGTDGNHVFKSTDGGDTWRAVREGLSIENVYSLAIDPQKPTTLYAGFAGTWGVHGAAGGRGVFRSADAAATWQALDTDPANSIVTALVVDPLTPSTIYMGTEVTGIFKSTDGGDRWHAINTGLPSLGILPVAIDPQRPNIVYGRAAGVFKST